MSRQFVFKNYWWIAILGGALGVVLVVKFTTAPKGTLVASVIAAALGFCYFVQQQKLAEMRLFRELFTGFNERYDKLSQRLREMVACGRPRDEADKRAIIDYFNLCGEEYLFYSEGYIHRTHGGHGAPVCCVISSMSPFEAHGTTRRRRTRTTACLWKPFDVARKHSKVETSQERMRARKRARASFIPVIGDALKWCPPR